jgi:hypothetical protein
VARFGPVPERMACGVCGYILDGVTDANTGEVGYQHAVTAFIESRPGMHPDDHLMVPVPVADIRAEVRCDFCLADNARWVLPVEDYEVGMGHWNRGNWGACDGCAEALRVNDWRKVIYRARRAHSALEGAPAHEETFHMLYAQLRQHIIGPVRLIPAGGSAEDQ